MGLDQPSTNDPPEPRNPPYEVRTPHIHGVPPTDDTKQLAHNQLRKNKQKRKGALLVSFCVPGRRDDTELLAHTQLRNKKQKRTGALVVSRFVPGRKDDTELLAHTQLRNNKQKRKGALVVSCFVKP